MYLDVPLLAANGCGVDIHVSKMGHTPTDTPEARDACMSCKVEREQEVPPCVGLEKSS